MPDRVVKTTLLIDEHGAVKAVKNVGEESGRTEHKLGQLDKGAKGLGKTFSGLKGVIAGGIGALGLGGLAFGLSDVVSKTKEVAAETEKFSAVTGIGASQSLAYTQALKARGLSGEAVTKAFGFLAKNLRTAELQEGKYSAGQAKAAVKGKVATTELGRQAKALKELGLNLTGFNQLNEAQKLETITKAFEALPDGMRKTRLERELFGRGGNQLAIVLDKGNLGLSHQIELVKKFYPTLKDGSKGLQELNEKSAESKMAWEGFQFTLGQMLIPTLTKLMAGFSEVVVEVEKGQGVWGELEHTFEGIGKFAGGVVGTIKEIAKAMGVKLPEGTLGAVLAAAGLHSVKHPIKATKTAANVAKKGGKYLLEHPYLAPVAIPVGGAAAYGALAYKERHTLATNLQGALTMLGAGGAPTGNLPKGLGSYSRTGGTGGLPAGSRSTQSEAALTSQLIASLTAPTAGDTVQMHIDGVKVGEAMVHNTRFRRLVAEAVSKYAHEQTARR